MQPAAWPAHRQGPPGQAPPAGSRLAGRRDYIAPGKLDRVEALASWVAERAALEVAIGALAAQPGCASVIAGATTPEQVKANSAAVDWIPAPEDLEDLDRTVPLPLPSR